jgi:hypothetical protein
MDFYKTKTMAIAPPTVIDWTSLGVIGGLFGLAWKLINSYFKDKKTSGISVMPRKKKIKRFSSGRQLKALWILL